MNCAAIIVGIDGFERFTLPLVKSIHEHEPDCDIFIVDNASENPYPDDHFSLLEILYWPQYVWHFGGRREVIRTERLSYSAAINKGHYIAGDADWYIVLSNDVLCTGPFAHLLEPLPPCVAGPQLWHEHQLTWIVGWAVFAHKEAWDAIGGFDEGYKMSSWEDVCFSTTALEKGYPLMHMPELPFVHLDQKQRFGLPGYEGSEMANYAYFMRKHAKVRV